ncbi:hypothetical protein GIB67_014698 [Kingdonia uniflora]|uniref:Uncharacterized protein n=1 Tax=Kingdonia uniflora TaxID=39325 RepID=A0A7J7NUL6_9MAGN|nr:hypothetical protein GIB67_014698 [Kingdonia uniflora]
MDHEPKWEELNLDCLVMIFQRVELRVLIFDIPFVFTEDPSQSESRDTFQIFSRKGSPFTKLSATNMIMFAVDRSCGCVTSVVLSKNCTFDSLDYITQRCSEMKSLYVPIELWERGDHLATLIVTQISRNCKNFVSLTVGDDIGHEEASAIAIFLPKIKYLSLRFAYLPPQNLKLIIDGCRELETLDCRDCIDFKDDVEIWKIASHIRKHNFQGSTLYEGGLYKITEVLEINPVVDRGATICNHFEIIYD